MAGDGPEFAGKTALITGAGSGIGRATAIAFAAAGARVMVSDLIGTDAEETVATIAAMGGEAVAMACDATCENQVAALVAATLDRFGRLDFAHNNVGAGRNKTLEQMDEADYRWISDVTMKSVFLGMRHQLPVMREQGHGVVVNTASMAGLSTVQTADIVYAGSKAAVIQMTAHAARTYGPHGLRVNCVAPGLVATKIVEEMFTPEQQIAMSGDHIIERPVSPSEVADAVLFLCSDRAAMITGHCLPVDGGMNAKR